MSLLYFICRRFSCFGCLHISLAFLLLAFALSTLVFINNSSYFTREIVCSFKGWMIPHSFLQSASYTIYSDEMCFTAYLLQLDRQMNDLSWLIFHEKFLAQELMLKMEPMSRLHLSHCPLFCNNVWARIPVVSFPALAFSPAIRNE
jgi:hypothetical protein